jgi:hypothetical protein
MRRLALVSSILMVAIVGACALPNEPAGSVPQIPYAVLYGHISAPTLTQNITVTAAAYFDSVHAIAGGTSSGYAGNFTQAADASDDYTAIIPSQSSGTYYVNITATGQGQMGFVSSTDTIRALRVRFDSATGGPHDSIAVSLTLP